VNNYFDGKISDDMKQEILKPGKNLKKENDLELS